MIQHHPLFLALDFSTGEKALQFLQQHNLHEIPVKVGIELFYKEGPSIISALKERGHPIFLDVKMHDIPNTVKQAAKGIASLGIDVVNVHAAGGRKMMEAALQGVTEGATGTKRPLILAVTQLTSTDERMLHHELCIKERMEDVVASYAQNAQTEGLDGVVCSVQEVELIRKACGDDFFTVTPGIRRAEQNHNDQVRIATPALAKQKGATSIVVGRGITQASNPKQTYQAYEEEWKNGYTTTFS